MPKSFTLTASAADLVLELTRDPKSFEALLAALYDKRYDGQLLLDFRRGRPRSVGFPGVTRVPIRTDPARRG